MANSSGPPVHAINSQRTRQRTQSNTVPRQPSEPANLTIEVGPNTTDNDILNAIVAQILGPEVRREAQEAATSRAPLASASTLPSASQGTLGKPSTQSTQSRSALGPFARLVRPFNRRPSPQRGESPQQRNTNSNHQKSLPRFIEDVRQALPEDIDKLIIESLGQDALKHFSRDAFPRNLASFLQTQKAMFRDDLYSALVDMLIGEARSYAFGEMPIRVIKLPELVFLERDGLAERLMDKLKKQPTQVFAEVTVDDIRNFLYNNPSFVHLCQSIIERWLRKEARYIILSHTWEGDELTYKNFLDAEQRARRCQSYEKLKHFFDIAHRDFGAEYAWADNVCIDKSSSSELDESIRSMFTWYRKSHACLIYLARSLSIQDLMSDRWFTRGWTLQELLAPSCIKFYNKNWQPFTRLSNDKKALGRRPEPPIPRSYTHLAEMILTDINTDTSRHIDADLDAATREEISQLESAVLKATGIPMNDIIDFKPGFSDGLWKRMTWIARRNTTRAEDKSYCMMGIFGVSMSVAYGEGSDRAFFRLFETLLRVSSSPDLFLWAGRPIGRSIHVSSMIPSSPECYIAANLRHPSADFEWDGQRSLLPPREPITLTNVGLCISVLAIPELQPCSYVDPGQASPKTMLLKTPLSDEPVSVTLLNDAWISFRVYEDGSRSIFGEFAFAALLLYRRDEKEQWRRLLTRDLITFECAQSLRYKELEPCHVAKEWTGSAIGSSWKLPGTPEMTLQTLYL